jgi:DNA-binding PadR family transcriptional regulator
LTLLEDLGHLTVTDGEDGRKLHTITEEGAASLVANRKAVEAIFARIAQAGASGGPAPLIQQALDKLEHTLRLRLSRGPLDETKVQHVVSKLDEASAAIEQS